MQIEKSKIGRVGCQTREWLMLLFKSEGHLLAQFPLAWERGIFCFIPYGPSIDCMRPTYTMEGDIFIQSPLIWCYQNIPIDTSWKIFDCISGHCSPAKFWYVKLTVTSMDSLCEKRDPKMNEGKENETGREIWYREEFTQLATEIQPLGPFEKRRHFSLSPFL